MQCIGLDCCTTSYRCLQNILVHEYLKMLCGFFFRIKLDEMNEVIVVLSVPFFLEFSDFHLCELGRKTIGSKLKMNESYPFCKIARGWCLFWAAVNSCTSRHDFGSHDLSTNYNSGLLRISPVTWCMLVDLVNHRKSRGFFCFSGSQY